MKMIDKLGKCAGQLGASMKMLATVALRSRLLKAVKEKPEKPLLILGNGPSLNETIATQRKAMDGYDLLAVNFAANAPVFTDLKPQHYVLADPHFFDSDGDANVEKLWKALNGVTWPMTLHLPANISGKTQAKDWLACGTGRRILPFNMTPAQGFPWLTRMMIDAGLAMPRPRNVLIPSIMAGMRMGYRHIAIAGADHTWTRTLSVDDQNRVVTLQPHFYSDNKDEKERVASVYKDIKLHEILQSMTIAFRSYHEIAAYARQRGIEIVNVTPGSFIDAFPRQASLSCH